MVGISPYCVLANEAQRIRIGRKASLSEVYRPVTERKEFSDDEEIKLMIITDPRIREGLLKKLKFGKS